LRCTKEELAAMEPFIEVQFLRSEQPFPELINTPSSYLQPYATSRETIHTPIEVERIPVGELAVRRGTRVEATDGDVGKVGELVLDPESGKITHLVLLEGHLWGKKEIILPLSAIERVYDDTVYLKIAKEAVSRLPTFPVSRQYRKDTTGKVKLELYVKVFEGTEKAAGAFEELRMMHLRGSLNLRSAAVMVKDNDGQTSLHERGDVDATHGTLFGAVTGGLIGLLGGPIGAVVGAAAGAATGRAAAKRIDMGFSEDFLQGLRDRLQPDSSALIVLIEHEWRHKVTEALAGVEGVVLEEALAEGVVAEFLGESDEATDTGE
jgi:uncharacterized membrane protein/sporulation protein YlmC with PRC-barrel domain